MLYWEPASDWISGISPHCTPSFWCSPAGVGLPNSVYSPLRLTPKSLQCIIIESQSQPQRDFFDLTPKRSAGFNPPPAPSGPSVPVPGSKSITNRLLLLTALARGTSQHLRYPAQRRHGRVRPGLSSSLGFRLKFQRRRRRMSYRGFRRQYTRPKDARIWCGSAGTASRLSSRRRRCRHGAVTSSTPPPRCAVDQ